MIAIQLEPAPSAGLTGKSVRHISIGTFITDFRKGQTAITGITVPGTFYTPDKLSLGVRELIERLMIQRLSDNDEIVSRYLDDQAFQDLVFPALATEIYETIEARRKRSA